MGKLPGMHYRNFFILFVAAAIFVGPASSMNFTPAAKQALKFTVYRGDAPIGYHNFNFRPKGAMLEVDIDVDLEVKMMFVTAFKFRHVASEVWENGRLIRMESETDDDGDPYKVKVERRGDGMLVEVNGQRRLAPGDILPSNLWNRAILKKDKILHPILGQVLPLKVTDLGMREIEADGFGKIPVEGFELVGGEIFQREVWYSKDGRLIEVGFNTPLDGSRITYKLDSSVKIKANN